MRVQFDCVLLAADPEWGQQFLQSLPINERLRLRVMSLPDCADESSSFFLRQQASNLRRYDACLLPISTENLAWARRALLNARPHLATPVLGLTHNLKAAALADLHQLGLADYLRVPLCLEELRARIIKQRSSAAPMTADAGGDTPDTETIKDQDYSLEPALAEQLLCENILQQDGLTLDAYAAAVASRYANSQESFKAAKSRVVARFEQAYIYAALDRYDGNIAMAARSAQKHRRAFWGLMRKHQIDAYEFKRPRVKS